MIQCLAKNKDTDTLAALNSHPLQQDMGSDEDQLEEDMPSHPLVDDDDSEDEGEENLEADVGRCKRILCGGGVLWIANLAAAHDEDGALLPVFYAHQRGKRVKVDAVLGGKWLRSLSPIVLDYSGHGSVSFARRTKGGGKELVTIAGCN
ncbi:hypothetical protein CYMTET_12238 [Cymbomonas tetramitiformis]|uniref:Uncharacterized protein n=1 Tax=Cymbomonas tetramitiformis TaxID=36881 RepID=A0AAE0GKS9_9CHLO|nr:hypothetical protein CYMTET_12238 [Cymbomonas tetramitiformis]